MERIRESGAKIIASANPGCLLQLEAGLRRYRVPGRVLQVTQLLDESYRKGDRASVGLNDTQSRAPSGGTWTRAR